MLRLASVSIALSLLAALPARGQLLDDFESYADTPALQSAWSFASLDTSTPNPGSGTKSLRRDEIEDSGAGWSCTHVLPAPTDATGEKLVAWVRRDPSSVAPSSFALGVGDGSSACASGSFFSFSDSAWHRIELDIDAECAGIDRTAVTFVRVLGSNLTLSDGQVLAGNFDEVGLYFFTDGFESGNLSAWSAVSP